MTEGKASEPRANDLESVVARVRRQTERYMDTAYYDPVDMRAVLDAASRVAELEAELRRVQGSGADFASEPSRTGVQIICGSCGAAAEAELLDPLAASPDVLMTVEIALRNSKIERLQGEIRELVRENGWLVKLAEKGPDDADRG